MTGGAVFFNRTGAKGFVTAAALPVDGISELGYFFITFGRVMAFNARLRLIIFIFSQSMMAVTA